MRVTGYNLSAISNLQLTSRAIGRVLRELSSDQKEGVDRSPLFTRLDSKVRSLAQVSKTLNVQQGFLQTADSALQSQLEILQKIREIATQAANGILSATDRANLQTEVKTLLTEYDRINNETEFNDIKILQRISTGIDLQTSEESIFTLSGLDTSSSQIFRDDIFNGSFGAYAIDTTVIGFIGDSGDFNNDGAADVATVDQATPTQVILQINNGSGKLTSTRTLVIGSTVTNLETADINGDGTKDLIIGTATNAFFYQSNGDGSFNKVATIGLEGLGAATDYEVADLNSDGDLDLLALYGSRLNVFLSDGSGGYSSATSYGTGTTASSVKVLDMNGDGSKDVAIGNSGSDNITLYLGNGTGSLQSRSTLAISSDFTDHRVQTGDFNGDGKADLIAYGGVFSVGPPVTLGQRADVYLGNGLGTFTLTTNFFGLNPDGGSSAMKVADFNKDGIDDFGEGGRIFLATGGGNFASSTYPTNYIGGSSYLDDFNGDGLIDIRAFALGLWEIVYGQSNSLARRSAVNVLSTESAQDLLPLVDGAIETLQNAIAKIGSSINRLDLARDQQSSLAETLSESRERLFAVDFAESTAELVKLQIQQQAQIAVLAQANLQQRSLVQLFQLL